MEVLVACQGGRRSGVAAVYTTGIGIAQAVDTSFSSTIAAYDGVRTKGCGVL